MHTTTSEFKHLHAPVFPAFGKLKYVVSAWGRKFMDELYIRVPEGILGGFMFAPLIALVVACMLSRGIPSPLAAAAMILGGVMAGVFAGVVWGLLRAAWEALPRNAQLPRP
jgi:hypothetical protein